MFAIWLPMLAGDSRSAWDSNVLDDPRVHEFWDGGRIAGRWFADQQLAGLGGPGQIVWDAYYAFPSTSSWNAVPTGVLAAFLTALLRWRRQRTASKLARG